MTDREPQTRTISQVAATLFTTIEDRYNVGGVDAIGIPTGFYLVDEYTGGLQKDNLVIVAARTAVGKTAFGLQLALNVAQQGYGVVVYSLEMSAESLVIRLISRLSDIAGGRIIRGKFSPEEMVRVKDAIKWLETVNLRIVDTTITSPKLLEHALYLTDEAPIDLVIVDYVGLLRDENKFGETERVGRISGNLRALARPDYLNVPVVALSQLNRNSESREGRMPELSDLRWSGDLEQDANIVIFPHRPYVQELATGAPPLEQETDAKLIIAKNREGPIIATNAVFHPRKTMWTQIKPEAVVPAKSLVEQVKQGRQPSAKVR